MGKGVPRKAAVEKQNCGVSAGWGGWETISSVALGGEGRDSFDQIRFATVEGVGMVFFWVRELAVVVWKVLYGGVVVVVQYILPVRI